MKKLFLRSLIACILLIGYSNIYAKDVGLALFSTQSEIDTFSKEIGSAMSYKQYQPAKPLGLTGFDVGVQVHATPVKSNAIWDLAFENDAPEVLPVPIVFVKKGLPFKLDVGVRGLPIAGTNLTLLGGNIKYSILEGTVATPAVGVSLDYAQLSGSDDFDLTVTTINASVSKGFGPISPYGGIAMDQINMKINNAALKLAGLDDPKDSLTRFFVGLKFSPLPIFSVTAEVNSSETMSYGLAAAVGF